MFTGNLAALFIAFLKADASLSVWVFYYDWEYR